MTITLKECMRWFLQYRLLMELEGELPDHPIMSPGFQRLLGPLPADVSHSYVVRDEERKIYEYHLYIGIFEYVIGCERNNDEYEFQMEISEFYDDDVEQLRSVVVSTVEELEAELAVWREHIMLNV